MASETKDAATLTRERGEWLSGLPVTDKEELLFEFDMLLRGLDRYFHLDNLFYLNEPDQAIHRGFTEELGVVSHLLKRATAVCEALLGQPEENVYHFQRFLETNLGDNNLRDQMAEKSVSQETPRESLYLLYDVIRNLQPVVEALTERRHTPYAVFKSVGQILRKSLLQNRYFNPLQSHSFNPAYDKIQNKPIAQIVSGIAHKLLQRRLSFVFLACFRLLHYLRFVNTRERDLAHLKSMLLVFVLVRSDARALLSYLETGFKEHLFDAEGRLEPDEGQDDVEAQLHDQAVRLVAQLDLLAYQLSMEIKKLSEQELCASLQAVKTFQLRVTVENVQAILLNFFQQMVVSLAQIFGPGLDGTEIFPQYESRSQQSKRLLEEVAVFRDLIAYFEERVKKGAAPGGSDPAVSFLVSLKKFLDYFRNQSFVRLRIQDVSEFSDYFKIVLHLSVKDLESDITRETFLTRSTRFRAYLDLTIQAMRRRDDLRGIEPSAGRVRNLLESFLPPPEELAPRSFENTQR